MGPRGAAAQEPTATGRLIAEIVASSFRDPSGFVYRRDGELLRQVNQAGRDDFDLLTQSGLYPTLVDRGLLVAHEEVDSALAAAPDAYKVIRPDRIPFVSYPYEWCFTQLKDAALTTSRSRTQRSTSA